jgi:hypothetical protein
VKGDVKFLKEFRDDFVGSHKKPKNHSKNGRKAELELGRESSKSKTLCSTVKYWCSILLMGQD